MKGLLIASLALLCCPLALAQATPLSEKQQAEVAELKGKAKELTKRVSEITAKSNLQDSDDGIRLLKQVVDELASIRERLKAIEDARSGDSKKQESLAKDVAGLKNTKFNGYLQFQYSNTDKTGASQPNAFLVRRARLGVVQTIDSRATLRLSFDFADGSSRMDTRLKDAILDYDMTPDFKLPGRISFGQMPLPIGFDLEKGDADREVPERATYSRSLFANERSRGVILRASPSKMVDAGIGIVNSLTTDDAEQAGLPPGQGNKLAGVGFIRTTGPNYRVGVSGFTGQRPAYTAASVTSPETNRWFAYLDGELRMPGASKFYVRGEVMVGHDRVPNATASATRIGHNMSGFQVQTGFNLDPKDQLNVRWEQFDPDRNSGGNAINGYAFSYQHFLSPMAKLQLAHELFTDESRTQRRYFQTTLRIQFRF